MPTTIARVATASTTRTGLHHEWGRPRSPTGPPMLSLAARTSGSSREGRAISPPDPAPDPRSVLGTATDAAPPDELDGRSRDELRALYWGWGGGPFALPFAPPPLP